MDLSIKTIRLPCVFFFFAIVSAFAAELSESLPEETFSEIAFGLEPPVFTQGQIPALPTLEKPYKHSSVAVLLSALFPGLGHVYLQDGKTAAALIGSSGASLGAVCYSSDSFAYGIEALSTIWMYGLYGAYRDANLYNGSLYVGYKIPTDDFGDLAFAPFKWSVIKKPEVWGGVLGSFLVAAILISVKERHQTLKEQSQSMQGPFYPLLAIPTAISEEALFRGFLQSQLSEWLTPVGGIFTSSMLFGAAHLLNGLGMDPSKQKSYYTFTIPFITCLGLYQGWLTYKNSSLQESVAMHMWYDFILMGIGSWTAETVATGQGRFAINLPF